MGIDEHFQGFRRMTALVEEEEKEKKISRMETESAIGEPWYATWVIELHHSLAKGTSFSETSPRTCFIWRRCFPVRAR